MRHLKLVPISRDVLGRKHWVPSDATAEFITGRLKDAGYLPKDATLDGWDRPFTQDCIILRYEHPSFDAVLDFDVMACTPEDSVDEVLLK